MGGGQPIVIQSMTNTPVNDVETTLAQIKALTKAGCRVVRIAVPNRNRYLPSPAFGDKPIFRW